MRHKFFPLLCEAAPDVLCWAVNVTMFHATVNEGLKIPLVSW